MIRIPRIDRSRLVEEDLLAIAEWIAQSNPNAARCWLNDIESKFELLVRHPSIPEAVSRLHPGWRRISFGKYVIFFEPLADGVILLRVLHGARSIDDLLD